MHICICDDDKSQHEIIKNYINGFSLLTQKPEIISRFSGNDLIKDCMSGTGYDILFMDIQLDSVSGLEVAQTVRRLNPNAIIIFISNHPDYVFEAFSVEALHFMVKPITELEFKRIFVRAISKYNSLHSFLPSRFLSDRAVICINDILYCEGYNRHVMIYTDKGKYESVAKLSDIYEMLSTHGFVQTHQGFIVNMSRIRRFDKESVTLNNGTAVPVSQRRRTQALRIFDDYLKGVLW